MFFEYFNMKKLIKFKALKKFLIVIEHGVGNYQQMKI